MNGTSHDRYPRASTPHPASFRDPSARIYVRGEQIFRHLTGDAIDNFRHFQDTGLLNRFSTKGWIASTDEVDGTEAPSLNSGVATGLWLEHAKLPFISYPYEWPFRALQRAALLHLEIQLEALEAGVALSDATAYNIQFHGARPIFIDIASFRPYENGELWSAHRQFCEQFLNPLLLQAHTGVPYNSWYRGTLEGIPTTDLERVLPVRTALDWRVLINVLLQARLERSALKKETESLHTLRKRTISRQAFAALLRQLHRWTRALKPAGIEETTWREYESNRLYNHRQQSTRVQFVQRFVSSVRPQMVWDLGCNAGEFSVLALEAGAGQVIGFDLDNGALATAFDRAESQNLAFLPLYFDAANPSPEQGWSERERHGLKSRANAEAVLSLAFSHHLMIGKNVPIAEFLDWLLALAPTGVVEFVDKQDPQVQTMLAIRDDIFGNYSVDAFAGALNSRARIIDRQRVPDSDRHLFWYCR